MIWNQMKWVKIELPAKTTLGIIFRFIFTQDENSFSPEWQKFCLIGPSSPDEFSCFDSALCIASSDQKQHVHSPCVTVRWFYESPVLSKKIFEFHEIII